MAARLGDHIWQLKYLLSINENGIPVAWENFATAAVDRLSLMQKLTLASAFF
jgi:hypothetical protein